MDKEGERGEGSFLSAARLDGLAPGEITLVNSNTFNITLVAPGPVLAGTSSGLPPLMATAVGTLGFP